MPSLYSATKPCMNVYEIDPTTDARWDDLLQNHPQASIFHTPGWLEALKKTYDYTPVAFTTSPPGSPLTNAIPFCKINGFFGKPRLVSLPFSDHCEPLVETDEQLSCLLTYLQERREAEGWDYVELRPKTPALTGENGFGQSESFFFHQLDLRRDLDEILLTTHKNCIQRKLRRAEASLRPGCLRFAVTRVLSVAYRNPPAARSSDPTNQVVSQSHCLPGQEAYDPRGVQGWPRCRQHIDSSI